MVAILDFLTFLTKIGELSAIHIVYVIVRVRYDVWCGESTKSVVLADSSTFGYIFQQIVHTDVFRSFSIFLAAFFSSLPNVWNLQLVLIVEIFQPIMQPPILAAATCVIQKHFEISIDFVWAGTFGWKYFCIWNQLMNKVFFFIIIAKRFKYAVNKFTYWSIIVQNSPI